MIHILANDGIDALGHQLLLKAGFQVNTEKVPQENLAVEIGKYDVIIVRSATKITAEIMDAGIKLKLIGRGGVGLDNIDVEYAKLKNIKVINTPQASSNSVAELVFTHIFSGARHVAFTNRALSVNAPAHFNASKKMASSGVELRGKTIGIIGLGRIGQEVARIAYGLGMNVIGFDPFVKHLTLDYSFHDALNIPHVKIPVNMVSKEDLLSHADFITLHVPFSTGDKPVIGADEIHLIKDGAAVINCSRGGVVDESELYNALKSKKLMFAGLDVFSTEPPMEHTSLFELDNISLSPHIGASTVEAQNRIGIELAEKIIENFLQVQF